MDCSGVAWGWLAGSRDREGRPPRSPLHLGRYHRAEAGRVVGLKWDDIDLEVGTLQVRRTLTTARGGPVFSAPKTKGSRRTVRLSQTALEALRSHPGASIGGDRPGRQSVARERPHIRVGSR